MVPPKSFHELTEVWLNPDFVLFYFFIFSKNWLAKIDFFQEGLGIGGCIHDFWIKAMVERQVSLKESKVNAKVRGLKVIKSISLQLLSIKFKPFHSFSLYAGRATFNN